MTENKASAGTGCAWVVGVAVLLAVLAIAYGSYLAGTPEGQARTKERDMIERCRKAQNDELEELSTRRLMRTACDRMEDDFRRKWNRDP